MRRWRALVGRLPQRPGAGARRGRRHAALLGISLLGDLTGFPDGAGEDVIDALAAVAMASVPFAFLVGLLRSRLSRAAR